MKFEILILLFGAGIYGASAQPPVQPPITATGPGAAGAGRGGGPAATLKSPEIAADGKVTFRLRAPNAKEVLVLGIGQASGPGSARLAMEKNEQGIWSVTTDTMKPGIYQYSFSVDGARFTDPGNNRFQTGFGSASQSRLHVPGPVVWEPAANIERGAVTRHFYHSEIAGDDRDFWVYTPANYDGRRKEPYPILFLLHGLGDEANSWMENGAANVILDNLIAQGKAKPMVMVNTLGYGFSGGPASARTPGMLANFSRTLLEEVLPQVEKRYNVSKEANRHAIAGLSMGGAEATLTGLNNLDKFAWIGSFSGAYVMWPGAPAGGGARAGAPAAAAGGRGGPQTLSTEVIDQDFPKLDVKANSRLRLLWITCGTSDGLIGVNRNFRDWLQSRDVKLTYVEVPDIGHVWPFWRQNLADFAPLLFQTK